ncbi:MAG: histidinol dehydrogenase [Methanolinea sp.]|jgi:histidinol dehydrogenase|nr:histidinol dehydrogenase [Methanolinea sp.]
MLGEIPLEEWIANRSAGLSSVKPAVEEIIARVREGGDAALRELTQKFDGVFRKNVRVTRDEIENAYSCVDDRLIESLEDARSRITRFHEMQRQRNLWLEEIEPGVFLGMRTVPLDRIGAYVPGGRAAYASTALMTVIPARVAGVGSVCCCSPPPIAPLSLVAMDIAGADEVFAVGGAQAVAAMALGTESIRPVQKIVGPGNVYVTTAKMVLRDVVEIDFPAGPSEIVILADGSARPDFIAADIIAQAEHDPKAACYLVALDPSLPGKVTREIGLQVGESPRKEILRKALENTGYTLAASLEEAITLINKAAPEHLSLQVSDPLHVLMKARYAGSVFVGSYSAVACGDYGSGTNHVLPTAGYASTHSGLDVMHFCTRSTIQMVDREGLGRIADMVERLAYAEGLEGHARSVRIRRSGERKN